MVMKKISLLFLAIFLTGCAYFNTFYNAQQYFKKAEEQRLENIGDKLPKEALNNYKTVIEKCEKVLADYPESKYRHEAILLSGISRYYRNEIKKAEITFKTLAEEKPEKYGNEAQFWLALCKSKRGNSPAALDNLQELVDMVDDRNFQARIYLARAAIMLDEKMRTDAYSDLEKAAELTADPTERSQIYYEIAFLAKEDKDYDRALRAFKQVLKNSISKSRIAEANLEMVRIYRLMGDLNKVESLVENMLENEDFEDVYGPAQLEISKYYVDLKDFKTAEPLLEVVAKDYLRTEASAEALFLLAEIRMYEDHSLDSAKIYFDRSMKEISKNPFRDRARENIKKIDRYKELVTALDENLFNLNMGNTGELSTADSTAEVKIEAIDSVTVVNEIARLYYEVALMEYQDFRNIDLMLDSFNEITSYYHNTEHYPKALYALSQIHHLEGDEELTDSYRDLLLEFFPDTEYARWFKERAGLEKEPSEQYRRLREAEQLWHDDKELALKKYKSVLALKDTSQVAAQAALFLAYQYDYIYFKADSAFHYYSWLNENYPQSEQFIMASSRYRSLNSIINSPQESSSDTTRADAN